MKTSPHTKKIRASANGQVCTLRIAGVCNYRPETTVLAHISLGEGSDRHRVGQRNAVYACSACHDAIDGRTGYFLGNEGLNRDAQRDKWFYIARALVRTAEKRDGLGL